MSALRNAPCKTLSETEKKRFFPAGRPTFAKSFCFEQCTAEIRKACLEDVLSFEEPGLRWGVWGGTTASERDEIYGDTREMSAGPLSE